MKTLWYSGNRNQWPRIEITKPYSYDFGYLRFMPRYIKPEKAQKIGIRRLIRN